MRRSPARTARSAASAALILGVAACSSPDPTSTDRPGPEAAAADEAAAAELAHVHGVGVNPADGAIYAATHHGLVVVDDGGTPRLVGDGRQDTMGFTVTGDDSFLASGHPAPGQDAPPNLGLLRSDDAGLTWRTVSAEGSDFHALTATGDQVYGLDSTTGTLRRSSDGGTTWQDGPPLPARAVDVDPADPQRLLATTETGLVISTDGGISFTSHPVQPPELLVLVDHLPSHRPGSPLATVAGLDLTGRLWIFDGQAWTGRGSLGGTPDAFTASSTDSYVAALDAQLYRSDDAGRSWRSITGSN